MGVGPFSSESTANRTDYTLSDSAQLIDKKAKVAQGQATFVDNTHGRLNTGVSLDKNAQLNTGLQVVGGTGATNISVSNGLSGSGLDSLVGQLTTASSGQIGALTGLLSDQQKQLFDLAKSQQSDVSTLADNKQTNGDSSRNKIVLIVVLAVIGLLGLLVWRK